MNSKPHIVEHDTITLKTKATRLTQIGLGILATGILIAVGLTFTTSRQLKQIATLNIEAETGAASFTNSQKVSDLIEANPQKLDQLLKVFPSETTIVDFLQTIETLVRETDPEASVKFSALTPVKVDNQLTIPFTIRLKTTPIDTITLLQKIERLPYIIEIISLDAHSPQGVGSVGDVTISAKVYAKDPFNQ